MTSQLAKDVASELERRRRRRRMMLLLVWAALIVAALLYLRCGKGWGTGGKTPGAGGAVTAVGSGAAETKTSGPKRCVVRISAQGITVDGKRMVREDAVTACKQTEGALITVTGDARQGDWDELRTALEQAGVPIFTRGR